MDRRTVMVANRGEVALRIIHATAAVGWRSVAVYAEDDEHAGHVRHADASRPLAGRGVAAYLDGDRLLEVASDVGAAFLHPGYGFLSEDAAFARRCEQEGVTFVGPPAEVLETLGDKLAARSLARDQDVPVPEGSDGPVGPEEARAFLRSLDGAPMVIKAVAGGGGRGMRIVRDAGALEESFERCRSEARRAFGDGSLYVERLVPRARHIEVQVVGDGTTVVDLGTRDCSLQRRHQKLIEIAPAPHLSEDLRETLTDAATRMAAAVGYTSLGTFEFLVNAAGEATEPFVFIEANPRLQVEHTVTEEVTGLDLVAAQLRLAAGASLADLGLGPQAPPRPRGAAVQVRVNAEAVDRDGTVRPTGGTISVFEAPTGHGIRTDTAARSGYELNPAFDTLLAKVIARAPDTSSALRLADRALAELRTDGVGTNAPFLRNILRHPALERPVTTTFIDEHLDDLVPEHGERSEVDRAPTSGTGTTTADAPTQGTVLTVGVEPGDAVDAATTVAVLEAMKMEHVVRAGTAGFVREVLVDRGQTVPAGAPIVRIEEADVDAVSAAEQAEPDLDRIRDDLAEVLERQATTQDEQRPDAVARRREQDQRTARENIDDLCDPGSFVEYGSLVVAAQRQRRDMDELIERTPADGLITGIGRVNGDRFDDEAARCAVLAYDATVLAGTQGQANHAKKDRLFEVIDRLRLPTVLFAEGGGGRPGDTDTATVTGLHTMAFALFARLSGRVPTVGIASRYCFAGNAALLGCCDVIIATEGTSIGMGGPAMIEGGGLGRHEPEEIGPVSVQATNGVIDVVVADEAEAVEVTKRYLSYFQGPLDDWECDDQRRLRHLIPEDRRRVYDVREVIDTLVDRGSVLELRERFGRGMITTLARIEGRPVGLIANDPRHLGGAIDSDGADKAARFLQLCDAFDLPVVSLCDTPGFMVGPEAEATAQVRHFARMFVTGASMTVPYGTVVLRKGYGLGAQAMAAGSFHASLYTIAWPTGEFGGMNIEGAVRLGFRRELEAIEDPEERQRTYEQMVELGYEHGKALNVATYFEIDDVIDPADTRHRIVEMLRAAPPPDRRPGERRPMVDTW